MGNLDLYTRVEEALSQVRPYLEADSGNVSIIDITDEMIVRLRFHGACSSCSMSSMTLRAGIEQTILKMVPEIKSVIAITEEDELIN
jgi:Fe-S cluster biogenesis protein NfuA